MATGERGGSDMIEEAPRKKKTLADGNRKTMTTDLRKKNMIVQALCI